MSRKITKGFNKQALERRTSKKRFDKKALELWREIVIRNAGDKCEICGRTGRLSAHHFWGRKNNSTRYYVDNGVALCYSCHVGTVLSAHESPAWFREEMIKRRGKKWYNSLQEQWRKTIKWNEIFIKENIDELNS